MSVSENPYSRKAEFHLPTPDELALMSTPYSSRFQKSVEENAKKIKERRVMREALQKNSSKKQD